MSFVQFFEYRHKKFDLRKRPVPLVHESSMSPSPCPLTTDTTQSFDTTLPIGVVLDQGRSMGKTSRTKSRTVLAPYFVGTRTRIGIGVGAGAAAATQVVCQQPPEDTILSKVNAEMLEGIYKYHGNMVRTFPKKERTPRDQERRDKNTVACRMSRRVRKLHDVVIAEQYTEYAYQHRLMEEKCLRAAAYFKQLMKLDQIDLTTA